MNQRQVALEQLCRAKGIATLYVFGSRAHEVYGWLHDANQQLPAGPSDVDLGAQPLPGVQWDVHEKVLIALAFEDFFAVRRVDLVVLNEADPFVTAEIIRGNRLFAQDAHRADEYDLYVLRRAGDLIPLERERLALIFRIQP